MDLLLIELMSHLSYVKQHSPRLSQSLYTLKELSLPSAWLTCSRNGARLWFWSAAPPVANAIKLLQACIYKSVNTGLFLTSLVATSIVKFMLLMLDR